MNRTFFAAAMFVAVCTGIGAARAATSAPGIGGTVYQDFDSNNGPSAGEGVVGVSLNLFQDNGDGIFDPNAGDIQIGGSLLTDDSGVYCFTNLVITSQYFVQRPAQTVGTFDFSDQVSSLLVLNSPQIMIDAFENNQGVKASPSTPTATSTMDDPSSNVIGKERDLYVKLASGIGEVELRSNAFGVKVLQFDNTSGVVGQGIITWDGKDLSASPTPSLGLGNVDLTSGGSATGFVMKMGVDATGSAEHVRIRIFKDDPNTYSELSVPIPVTDGTATTWTYAPFSDFVGSVLPDDVNAIQMLLGEGAKSVDAQLDTFATLGPANFDFRTQVVPEPSGIVLLMLGVWGCWSWRRRA
jgi:hypothetical protein